MLHGTTAIDDLIDASRESLAPAPFPPRRDIDYTTFKTTDAGRAVVFHDAFWMRQTHFACFVARLRGDTLPRNLGAAHLLRSLVRAALRRHDAQAALQLCGDSLPLFDVATADLAVAALKLRIDNGDVTLGATGRGAAIFLSAGAGFDAVHWTQCTRLAVGQRVGVGIGEADQLEPAFARAPPTAPTSRGQAPLGGSDGAALSVVTLRSLRESSGRSFTLVNDVAEIGHVLNDIVHYLQAQGLTPDGLLGLDVALDELLTNTILYAYGDGGAHEIVVDVRLRAAIVRIEIQDDGSPFDPTKHAGADTTSELDDRPIGGLGLHLVRSIFDTLSYQRVLGWNVLVLTKTVDVEPRGS